MASPLRSVNAVIGGVARVANAIGTLVVLGLVLLVNYDVVARGVFNAPFLGAVEVVQFSMVLIVFLQLPDVCRVDRLTRSDGFLIVLGGRYPAVGRALRRLINLISAALMAIIAYAIWPDVPKMYATQDFFGVPGVFTAPWWPVKLTIFVSAVMCSLIFFLKILLPSDKPVPLAPESEAG